VRHLDSCDAHVEGWNVDIETAVCVVGIGDDEEPPSLVETQVLRVADHNVLDVTSLGHGAIIARSRRRGSRALPWTNCSSGRDYLHKSAGLPPKRTPRRITSPTRKWWAAQVTKCHAAIISLPCACGALLLSPSYPKWEGSSGVSIPRIMTSSVLLHTARPAEVLNRWPIPSVNRSGKYLLSVRRDRRSHIPAGPKRQPLGQV
jgi:hypothetical protein